MPKQMNTLLKSLIDLKISSCPELRPFPDGGLPPKLQVIWIEDCEHLTPQEWGLNKMDSLRTLTIIGGSQNVESFPEEGLLPASLSNLQISEFRSLVTLNLRGLQFLKSLQRLEIKSCLKLHCLSEGRLPSSLTSLIIEKCPLLKAQCQEEQGEDWHKISHIPRIKICD